MNLLQRKYSSSVSYLNVRYYTNKLVLVAYSRHVLYIHFISLMIFYNIIPVAHKQHLKYGATLCYLNILSGFTISHQTAWKLLCDIFIT